VLAIPVLWTVGIILAVIGAILWLGSAAGSSWGHRWY